MVNIQRPLFDAVTFWGMLLIVILMAGAWIILLARQKKRFGVAAFVATFVVVGANVISDQLGWFTRLDVLPPPFMAMNFAILFLLLILGLGYVGQMGNVLVKNVSVQTLVALQIFRLPLEFLMLRAAYLQIMPMEFSMLGYNLDVLTGMGALLLTIYVSWKRAVPKILVWVWNVMGVVFLLVIAVLAALTSPNLHAFGTAPTHINSWVLYFPYSLLPSILVSCAVFGHILLTRKLLQLR
jgi:hypothetical protein